MTTNFNQPELPAAQPTAALSEIVSTNNFAYFAGIDWGSEKHRVCLMDRSGTVLGERWAEHSGSGLAGMAQWLREKSSDAPHTLAAAIEIPRGAIVETLAEHGFHVFSLNSNAMYNTASCAVKSLFRVADMFELLEKRLPAKLGA